MKKIKKIMGMKMETEPTKSSVSGPASNGREERKAKNGGRR